MDGNREIIDEKSRIGSSMKKGILKLMLMRAIAKGNDYPYAILKILKQHRHVPFQITKNEIYNALNALEKRGYVKSSSALIGGKVQKHYKLTPQGRSMVHRSKRIILQLIKEMKLLVSEFE